MLSILKYVSGSASSDPASAEDFHRFLVMKNGTHRTTAPGRLAAVDEKFFSLFGAEPQTAPLRVLDIGVSFGSTTADWLAGFSSRKIAVELVAMDMCFHVEVAEIFPGVRVLLEPKTDHPIQLDIAGNGMRTSHRRLDFLTGSFVWRRPLVAAAKFAAARQTHRDNVMFVEKRLQSATNVTLVEGDFLNGPLPGATGSFDVIRAANIMQPAYFSDEQMKKIANRIWSLCKGEGSRVIICQNHADRIDATFLRMRAGRSFDVEGRFASGSAAEKYLLNAADAAAGAPQ